MKKMKLSSKLLPDTCVNSLVGEYIFYLFSM